MVWVRGEIHKLLFKPRKKAWRAQSSPKLILKEKETTDPKEISNTIKVFYETLFKKNSSKTNFEKPEFLNSLDTKTVANQQSDLCTNEIRETDLFDSMKSMKNNKLLVIMDLTFWDGLKAPLMESINRVCYLKS